ncbi:MAG TPA: metallopeptidase TldD-related protein [Anaeromyxobacteraceae bacterium]|nr:metallopeptidase TldD-related protein [Anaeromyxobacteraceae bacterium]
MSRLRATFTAVLLLAAPARPSAQADAADPVLATLGQELDRLAGAFGKTEVPAYFLSFQLTDNRALRVVASFGALTHSGEEEERVLDVDLRVGDHGLDNTHRVRGAMGFDDLGDHLAGRQIPLDGDPAALRVALWRETERAYRKAVQRLAKVKANVRVKVEQEDRSGDFTREAAESWQEPLAPLAFDRAAWEARARRLTAPFAGHDEILEASVEVTAEVETRRYVNTEGSRIQISSPLYRLNLRATAKAPDGMELPLHRSWMSFRPDGLPDDAALERDVVEMIRTLRALVKAPLAEPYTGPAILSGRAAAVFFHEILGHRIEGQRQKDEEEAQTFAKRLNRRVLPAFLSVHSDPTLARSAGTELVGSYRYDDEGVKARPVTIVRNGVLKGFLMSRAPIEGFQRSNGHGRRQQGYGAVARQSNLVVDSSRRVSRARLKRMLIERARAAGKPWGLLFDDIQGGFTFTQRVLPNAFNVRPTVVYRVRLDGSEELVRGVDLIGTPLIAFSKIVATDDRPAVFNGVCGAESGWVPVSAVSPGLLISQVEVQRKEKSQERPPLLPPPPAAEAR